jgi:hypothetical protein
MDAQDYRIIVTLAASLAKPCIWNGKTVYEVDVEKFITAIDSIYPDFYRPISINGKILNPRDDFEETPE